MLKTGNTGQEPIDAQPPSTEQLELLWKASGVLTISVEGGLRWELRDSESVAVFLQLVERLESIDAIREGLNSVDEGQSRPLTEVFTALRNQHGLSD